MAAKPFIVTLTGLSGAVESGGLLYSFVRSTSTPRALYTDVGLSVPATNPVEANALGLITVYFNDALEYTWQAKTADDSTTLWEADVVGGVLTLTYINPDYDEHPIIEASWVPALGSPLGNGWPAFFGSAKPTTISGYGITDAYTKTEAQSRVKNHNEFPDPCFQFMDGGTTLVTKQKADFSGVRSAISVSSYTTGSKTVVCSTTNTGELRVGELVEFNSAADAALKVYPLRVTAVVANTSFTVVTEQDVGAPGSSAACTATPVARGDYTGALGGAVNGHLQKFADGVAWPKVIADDVPSWLSIMGCNANVLWVEKVTAGDEYIYWAANARQVAAMQGQTRTFGASVYIISGTGASARAYTNNGAISEGTGFATLATKGWIETTGSCAYNAVTWQEGVLLRGPVGSRFLIARLTSTPGAGPIGSDAFSVPRRQYVPSPASISPWVGVDLTSPASMTNDLYSFTTDMYAISRGQFGKGVSMFHGRLEGQSSVLGNVIGVCCRLGGATTYGAITRAPAAAADVFNTPEAELYGYGSGSCALRNGYMELFTGGASEEWGFLSWDIPEVILFADDIT